MRVAVIQFPGSNCDQDALYSLREGVGVDADYVWHQDTSLQGFGAVFVPGGFSYGDYLRCGAMAARSPIMESVRRFSAEGRPVIGACNGFQILCEAGILPGALLLNAGQKFLCQDVWLAAENRTSPWTEQVDRLVRLPIAHGEGRFSCSDRELAELEEHGQVAFRYCGPNGETAPAWNPNGSSHRIAGVLDRRGTTLGLMPHPERATDPKLGGTDGLLILKCLQMVNCA